MRSAPLDVVRVISISSVTGRKMIENLWYPAGYNIAAFPIAGGIFYPLIGLRLRPEIAPSLSHSVVVTLNAPALQRATTD